MMARKSDSLPLRLTLAVLLPLLLLIALAVQGMRARTKAAWDEIEEEAKAAAPVVAKDAAQWFETKVREIPRYSDPPQPGVTSPLDTELDRSDPGSLRKIMNNHEAGISAGGLPRQVLAALRLIELDAKFTETPEQARQEIAELAFRYPSILSPVLLQKVGSDLAPIMWRWEGAEEARQLLDQHPEGGWIPQGPGRYWWLEGSEEKIRYIHAAHTSAITHGNEITLPRNFGFRLSQGEATPRSAATPELLSVAPIPFGEGLRAEIFLRDPEAVYHSIRQQEAWTLGFVVLASLVSIGGLWLILTTLKRERKLNEMKSQFVASVSHELRAPVASIRLMADALEEAKLAPETAKEFHRLIAREGARLSTLVGNVLDHARIEQGRKVWKMEASDLSPLVADTLRVMQPLAAEKKITLLSRLAPVEATVDADAIQQALVNLLDNAIKFSPPGSSVEVELSNSEERRTCSIRVKDQGPGIPKEEQTRIFERFYRPGDELRRETQGTGIGLSLVKSIAEAHHGSVTVESEPGKGSSFILQLPLAP